MSDKGCDVCGAPVRLTVAAAGAFCGGRCASRRVPELSNDERYALARRYPPDYPTRAALRAETLAVGHESA